MPLVSKPCSCACRAERLARAGACPDWPIIGPTGAAQGVAPHADACEEMTLCVAFEVVGSNVTNVAFVNVAGRNVAVQDQTAQPFGGVRVVLVVIGGHGNTGSPTSRQIASHTTTPARAGHPSSTAA